VTQQDIDKERATTELAILTLLNDLQRKTGQAVGYISASSAPGESLWRVESQQETTGRPAPQMTPKPLRGVHISLQTPRA